MNLIDKFNFKIRTSKFSYFYRKKFGVFSDFATLSSDMSGKKNILIFGKAASIKEINEKRLERIIKTSDYKILANSVDIENHPVLSKTNFDTQCSTRVDDPEIISPVYSLSTLKKHKIKNLCVNASFEYYNGLSISRFRKYFKKYGLKLLYMDNGYSPIAEDPSTYGGKGLTIIQKIIAQALVCKSVKKIILIGVDFFGTKYLDSERKKNKEDLKRFYSINAASKDPRSTHGIPLLKYLTNLVNCEDFYKQKKLYLPLEVESYLDLESIKKLNTSQGFEFL